MDARKLLRQKRAIRKAEAPKAKILSQPIKEVKQSAPQIPQPKPDVAAKPAVPSPEPATDLMQEDSELLPPLSKPTSTILQLAPEEDATTSDKLPAGFFDDPAAEKDAPVASLDDELKQFEMEIGEDLMKVEMKAAIEEEEEEEERLDDPEDQGRLVGKLENLRDLRARRLNVPNVKKLPITVKKGKTKKVVKEEEDDDEDEDRWRSKRV
ncbi:hypothetical protein HDU67_000664 [Dinochytrium kinnereticum]|nr:hypothetical protein HDU67_000664 [Dinochytrium kinnereticum]